MVQVDAVKLISKATARNHSPRVIVAVPFCCRNTTLLRCQLS